MIQLAAHSPDKEEDVKMNCVLTDLKEQFVICGTSRCPLELRLHVTLHTGVSSLADLCEGHRVIVSWQWGGATTAWSEDAIRYTC